MDWSLWHVASVMIIGLAIVLEAIGAYCIHKERVVTRAGRIVAPESMERDGSRIIFAEGPVRETITPWARLWLKRSEHPDYSGVIDAVDRAKWLEPDLGPVLRGVARLSVAGLFLARFAGGQPPPFLGC